MKKALSYLLALAWGVGPACGESLFPSKTGAVFQGETAASASSSLTMLEQTLSLLRGRGWPVSLRVRLAANPYDATQPEADVTVPLSLPVEEQTFLLTQGVVRKALGPTPWTELLASLVAAHLSPPSSKLRLEWEKGWQSRLLQGDLENTAILELLWRRRADEGLRQLAKEGNPWRLLSTGTEERGFQEALWEIILAGLLKPEKLGFSVGPASWEKTELLKGDGVFRFVNPHIRWVRVAKEGDALGILASRLRAASARVVVVYEDGRFDQVALEPGQELPVPLWGVKELVLGILSFPPEATASFAFRPLRDYPVRLEAAQLSQEEGAWQLAWTVGEQQDVRAYVVEVWGVGAQGSFPKERHLIPTTQAGPAQLVWSWEGQGEPRQVKVFALTENGLLAQLFVTPVLNDSPFAAPKETL